MCNKIVIETNVNSITGKYLYSDVFFEAGKLGKDEKGKTIVVQKAKSHYHGILNKLVRHPVIGIVAAVLRLGLSITHTIGHLFAALRTQKKGHLFHAVKGLSETLKSSIEVIPIAGRIFTCLYSLEPGTDKDYRLDNGLHQYEINDSKWWFMKIYNPNHPDEIDVHEDLWQNVHKPAHYIKA